MNKRNLKHIEGDIYYCNKSDKFLKYNKRNNLYQWYNFPQNKTKPIVGVYYIYDKLHKKYYIGSSINIIARVCSHISNFKNNSDKSLMYQATLCHGIKYIEFGILEICNKESLPELEKYYISLSDSINNGWNVNNNTSHSWLRDRDWNTNNFYNKTINNKSPN